MKGWVLITGAARRIGGATALHLASQGWDVVIHYHRSADEAAALAQKIEGMGQRAVLAEIDLAHSIAVAKLIPALAAEIGHLTALINNASLFESDATDPEGTRHWAINVEAPRLLCATFVDQLPANTEGCIVNILDGVPPEKNFDAYNHSKNVLRQATLDDARRFAPRIRVNGIEPGPVLINERQTTSHFEAQLNATLLKHAIKPVHIAEAAHYLLTAISTTGALIPVEGGAHLLGVPPAPKY